MRTRLVLVVCWLAATAFAQPSSKPQYAGQLQTSLEQLARQHEGKVSLYAKNLKTDEVIAIDGDVPVKTASVIKLPVALEAMWQVKQGKLRLDEPTEITKGNQVEGSGLLMLMQPGTRMQMQDVMMFMITLSDGTATNMMIDKTSIKAVNERLASMGLKNTYLYKKTYLPVVPPVPPDQPKFGLGKMSAHDMSQVLESIWRCDLGDKALCAKLLDIMRFQQDRLKVPRYLDLMDTGEVASAIANKTGSLDDYRSDAALVFGKDAGGALVPMTIVAVTYDNKDTSWGAENKAEMLIGRMAKMIVDAWAKGGLASGKKTEELLK